MGEATAPSVLWLSNPGDDAVLVALDRRVGCKVWQAPGGIVVETGSPGAGGAEGGPQRPGDASAIDAVLWAIRACGIPGGLRVALSARSAGPMIGVDGPLAAATVGAAREVTGAPAGRGDVEAVLNGAEAEPGRQASALGAVHAGLRRVSLRAGIWSSRRVDVDPAWVEERLSLFDGGPETLVEPAPAGSGTAEAWVRALERRDQDGVGALLSTTLAAPPERQATLLAAARNAGASMAVWGAPGASILVAWHPPGEGEKSARGALTAALRGLGARPLPARIDLLGLEVE